MRVLFRIAVGVLLLLSSASFTKAQTVPGVVKGTVLDASNAAIPGADETSTNVDAAVSRHSAVSQHAKGGAEGSYRSSLVPPGNYNPHVRVLGFTEKQITGIKVDASQTVPVSVTLAVASATTTIDVQAVTTLVQAGSSDLSITLSTNFIDNIPLLSRDITDLTILAPAVTQGINFNAAAPGARESGTTNMLNGADNNDNFSEGGYNIQPPLESVSEFTVLTNNMSAQYGHAVGALVSTIRKSGANQFHDVAYEFNRNTDLNAADFFTNRAGNPKEKR